MEFTLELSDPVVVMQSKHTISSIFHKILATGLPVAKNLIKYNNRLEKKDEEEKEPINIELTEQKTDPYNDENATDFK